jgi:hypothetical protein
MRSQRASNFEHKGTVGNTVLDQLRRPPHISQLQEEW